MKPVLQNEAFVADVLSSQAEGSRFQLWWLGQSGFLIQWNGRHLLLDPYLSDALAQSPGETGWRHTRMTECVAAPQSLGFVDVVAATHNHPDHLDPATLRPLLAANSRLELVIPESIRESVVDQLRIVCELPRGLDAGTTTRVAGFRFHGVPAAHEQIAVDDRGRHLCLGYVIEFGGWTVYHSGDTVLYEGMVQALRRWSIDLALLPINGRGRGVAGNLTGEEAAQLASDIGARCVIPCHYDMFAFNTAPPTAFVEAARRLGQPCAVLKPAERWSSPPLG